MSGIGTNFGTVQKTQRQSTSITARLSAALRELVPATGEEVLTPHHTVPGVPTPPRFEFKLLENYIAFKMEGVEDSPIHSSEYKKSVYKLFFGDEFSPIKTVAINHVPIAKDVLAWQPDMSALNFANEFMAEAAGYGIDGEVFCATACTIEPHNTFGKFVSECMTQACGSSEHVKSVHRDQIKANVQLILTKVESGNRKFGGHEFSLKKGLAYSFGWLAKSDDEASSLASSCLMFRVALHHLRQLGNSDDLGDLGLAARLVDCLLSQRFSKNTVMGHLNIDDIIQKLGKHAEQAIEDAVFDQCAEVATSLLSLSAEPAQALLDHIAELQAMAQLNDVMEWFKDRGLTTIGGVDKRGNFAFGPYPGRNGSFDIERHGAKAFELAEAWALNPYADMARVTAILDYLQKKFPEHLCPSHPLLLANEKLKARLAASPVPEVRAKAALL